MVKTVFVECRANYDKQRAEHMQPVGETVFVVGEAEAPDSSGGPTIAGIVSHADMILGDAVEDVLAAHDAASGSSGVPDWPRTSRKRPSGWHRTTPAT